MIATLAIIWTLHVAAMLTPGANVLLITQLSASGNARGAACAALGITAGAAIWSSSAVLGVHTLFTAFPSVRILIQVAGALYLFYLALRLWRSQSSVPGPTALFSSTRAFRMGLFTNLSNPKSALFFGSVFSAALPVSPAAPVLFGVIALIVLNALWWHLLLAYVFSRAPVQSGYAAQSGLLSRLAGALLGALGVGLLIASLREV